MGYYSVAHHSSLLSLVRPLLGQEVLGSLVERLSANLDVLLCCADLTVANELLSQDYVLGRLVELSYLCGSEVVALDFDMMLLVEFGELLSPLVSRVACNPSFEHFIGVRCMHIDLVCFDGLDRLLFKHDSTSGRLLGRDVQP